KKEKDPNKLPQGVGFDIKTQKYYYTFLGKKRHICDTLEAAIEAKIKVVEEYDKMVIEKLLREPIKRNKDGIAVIFLRNIKKEIVAEALVDDNKYYIVVRYKWSFASKGYAHANINGKQTKLHRFIMNCYDRDVKIDHDNKQRLDCQVKNLKLSTDLLNSQNKTKMKGESSSQYIGVCYRKDTKKWRAGISTPDGKINLGS